MKRTRMKKSILTIHKNIRKAEARRLKKIESKKSESTQEATVQG
jgi:hypothetical protein